MFAPEHLISLLLLIPSAGVLLVGMLPGSRSHLLRGVSLAVVIATLICSLVITTYFDPSSGSMQLVQNSLWFNAGIFHVRYHVGVDGISLLLVLLTTLLMVLSILASWSITRELKLYLAFMLFLELGMLGVFVALDLILFYVFWEVMLIPMYFLIGMWGGEQRIYAAVKFFLYTMAGSLLMLAAVITLYFYNGGENFDLLEITARIGDGRIVLPPGVEYLLFLAFFIAFAIKVPLFPFHTWLPDAHVEAPTAGSVVLAGVLLKMGTYGLLRFCIPLFPAASIQLAPVISILALIGIVYGALVAMVQPDVKKLVAYSSVSHLGFVVLGIFALNFQSIQGALYQMINHGLSTGGLFLLVGMLYDRRHTRMISDFGGLAHATPRLAAFFMIVTLSSIGLPGLNGFVGEFLILQGTFLRSSTWAAIAASGMVLSAVYMLWMYQRVFLGEITHEPNRGLKDLNSRETLILLPLVILFVWMGIYSQSFLRLMDPSVENVLQRVEEFQDRLLPRYRVSGEYDGS
ncbi:MAG: NADH-quinone oxidoreductase subunit M [Acidobacteria bacterium]|nr:NADH-quinone oxidoreductase subunit M [Acidobacteriota bacterium]